MNELLLHRPPAAGVDATARGTWCDLRRAVAHNTTISDGSTFSIVAYVPTCLLKRLHATFGASAVLACQSMDALVVASERAPVSAVVLDPTLCSPLDMQGHSLPPVLARSTPVVLYTHASPSSIKLCFEWARAGAVQLVLAGIDDESAYLRELLTTPLSGTTDGVFINRLTTHLGAVPHRLASAVCRLFTSADSTSDLDALVAVAFMTHRSVDRWLRRAGLAPPKHFVGAAKLLRAHRAFASGETCLARAARRGGFASERTFARQSRALLGVSPSALRAIDSRDVHERVLRALRVV